MCKMKEKNDHLLSYIHPHYVNPRKENVCNATCYLNYIKDKHPSLSLTDDGL